MKEEEYLFVLDIGTRSVIGVAARMHGELLEVLRVESAEYSGRAVVDGQIENIEQTAKVASVVKEKLEEAMGAQLREVHVAAAGRVLKTKRASCRSGLDEKQPIDAQTVVALESKAVQAAYEELCKELGEEDPADFCCVGHTVTGYTLDGYQFSKLEGHRGKEAGVELIATFLPAEVVESLYTTMSMIGLRIGSMTLEPIAAMNAVVPEELRLLNVALVDVGAGTSDIAVASKGGVIGYTMVTMAGDEITEQVMQEFLVDFQTAERMKFQVGEERETVSYTDVLGFPWEVKRAELLDRIRPAVETLAQKIAQGVLQVGGEAPKAVFLVGGGSRTPELCGLLAKELSLDDRRVAIGGNNYMKRMVEVDDRYLTAEYATPIGIAVTRMMAGGGEGFTVSLNGLRLKLMGGSMNVMDALLRGGYQYSQMMGRSGKGVIYELDGERRIARGGLPMLAGVQVNGELASLSAELHPGDEILFTPASDGEDARPSLRDVVRPWEGFQVELFGKKVLAGTRAWVNGEPAEGERRVLQMDRISTGWIDTVGRLLEAEGRKPGPVLLNGALCGDLDRALQPGDRIEAAAGAGPGPGKPEMAPGGRIQVLLNGRPLMLDPKGNGEQHQFFDLLNYVDIDPSKPQGEIVLKKNGVPAAYLEPVREGDQIEIHWDGQMSGWEDKEK